MEANTEYWKQRCLLAESMLEDKFINNQDAITSPFEKFNWLYIEFINLLKQSNLTYIKYIEKECFIIDILDVDYKNIISVSSVSYEKAYENALEALKAYKQKIKLL